MGKCVFRGISTHHQRVTRALSRGSPGVGGGFLSKTIGAVIKEKLETEDNVAKDREGLMRCEPYVALRRTDEFNAELLSRLEDKLYPWLQIQGLHIMFTQHLPCLEYHDDSDPVAVYYDEIWEIQLHKKYHVHIQIIAKIICIMQ